MIYVKIYDTFRLFHCYNTKWSGFCGKGKGCYKEFSGQCYTPLIPFFR